MNFVHLKIILCLILSIALVGCVPTLQFQNEASERYFKSLDFEDPMLEANRANRANGVLILVRTGYLQKDNREQLSIYLGCDFLEPQPAKLMAAELVDSSGINLEAGEIDLNCPDSKSKVNFLKGSGYIHFYGETIPKLMLDKNLVLIVSIKAKDTIYDLKLPLTTSKVWVWPT